ncbi:MAG: hypothetical protein WC284_06325 [Candidimonas sp.]
MDKPIFPRRTSQVLAALGNPPHLELVQGEGYWYFIFDDGDFYETHSVTTYRLSHVSLDSWVAEGQEFLNKVEQFKSEANGG